MTPARTGAEYACERTEALAKARFGEDCRVVGYEGLTNRAAAVARVRLAGVSVESLIVKHLDRPRAAADLVADHPEFANEALTYRFLDSLGLCGRILPGLIGCDAGGVLVLADLGDAAGLPERGFDHLVPALARSLALLHGATHGKAEAYDAMRVEAGLGGHGDDRRKYGVPGTRRLFQAEAALCLATEGLSHREAAALARELEAIEATIAAPGDHLALIHDDLANARQTFDTGEAMFLLDFEEAKYSHALLDFVKPMIGEFEVDESQNIWSWQCPAFPLDLADRYREILATEFGRAFPDEDWDRHLAAALIYGAMGLIGRMAAWDPSRWLRGTRRQNINAVIHRLSTLLTKFAAFPAVRNHSRDYIDRLLV